MTTIPAIMRQILVSIPVSTDTTLPEAAIWLEVRQKSARMLRMAEKPELNLPNLLPTTSGIVTAIVFLIFGAKYARGIIAMDAASTYHTALIPHVVYALPAKPVVLPPPMLLAERENATIKSPILLPATI